MKIIVKLTVCLFLLAVTLNSWASMPESNMDVLNSAFKTNDTITHRQFQVSFVPYFGTNGFMTDSIVNDISINILAGYVYEVRVAEFGGMINIVKRNMHGCQFAGLGNIVLGKASGLQASGMFNISNAMDGVQIAGTLNTVKDLKGIQIAGLANHTLRGCGVQLAGLVNNAADSAQFQISGILNNSPVVKQFQISGLLNNACKEAGFQIGGIANNAKLARKFQISGLLNNTAGTTDFQISGLINNASAIERCQIAGFINNANSVTGLQASGFINKARCVKGVQIGFINIADSCSGLPIGILNFVKNGYHKLEFSADEMFYTNIAFRSGVQKFHGIISAGIKPDDFNKPLWTYGIGAGTSLSLSPKMLLDVDAMFQHVIKSSKVENNYLYKFYVGTDWQLFPKASLFFGVTYNFLVTDTRESHYAAEYSDIAPYTFTDHTYGRFNLKTWAGFKAGIRLF
jgi:hypothetical protein